MKRPLFKCLAVLPIALAGLASLGGCDAMAGKSDRPPAKMPPPEPWVPKQGAPMTAANPTTPQTNPGAPGSTPTTGPDATASTPPNPATTAGGTGTEAGPGPTNPPETAPATNLTGVWKGEPRIPAGGNAQARNLLGAQQNTAKKFGLSLEIVDELSYKLNLFGYKIEGRYDITNNFLTLRPERVQGVDIETARAKGVKGPEGKVGEIGDTIGNNMDIEIVADENQLKFNQGSGVPEIIFSR